MAALYVNRKEANMNCLVPRIHTEDKAMEAFSNPMKALSRLIQYGCMQGLPTFVFCELEVEHDNSSYQAIPKSW